MLTTNIRKNSNALVALGADKMIIGDIKVIIHASQVEGQAKINQIFWALFNSSISFGTELKEE